MSKAGRKGLFERFAQWLTYPDRIEQVRWLEKNYPGFGFKRLRNGRWWLSSKATGAALPELDVDALMLAEQAIELDADVSLEHRWLRARYPNMHLEHVYPGIWDVCDPFTKAPVLRLKVTLSAVGHCAPVLIMRAD